MTQDPTLVGKEQGHLPQPILTDSGLQDAHPKGASSRILLSAVVPIPVQGTLPCGSYNLGLCLSASLGLKYTSGA